MTNCNMTEEEALKLAQERFGPDAITMDRNGIRLRRVGAIPRYYIGTGPLLYGNGTTWAEALENMTRMWEQYQTAERIAHAAADLYDK